MLLVLCFQVWAEETEPGTCDLWLSQVVDEFHTHVDTLFSEDPDTPSDLQAPIKVYWVETENHADEHLLIESLLGRWLSNFTTIGDVDPLGDVRWPLVIFGPAAGKSLGFWLEGNSLRAPLPEELIKNVSQLKSRLPQWSVGFYAQRAVSRLQYLIHFGSTGDVLLPLASPRKNMNHYLHDFLHLASLLLPEEYRIFLQKRVQAFLALRQYLREDSQNTEFEKTILEPKLKQIEAELVRDVDHVTGMVGFLVLSVLSGDQGRVDAVADLILGHILKDLKNPRGRNEVSPLDWLRDHFKSTLFNPPQMYVRALSFLSHLEEAEKISQSSLAGTWPEHRTRLRDHIMANRLRVMSSF
ncbi:MAG: hypothetical protein AB7N80_04260 [Bdellovibrionales bacterium]